MSPTSFIDSRIPPNHVYASLLQPARAGQSRAVTSDPDPLADGAVRALAAAGLLRGRGADPLAAAEQAAGHPGAPATCRHACGGLLEAAGELPAWFDPARIALGQHVFVRSSVLSVASLLLGGLLCTYRCAGIARVLAATGRTGADARRRIFETAAMVHDVMCPAGLRPGGVGHRALLRVRLVHAAVRLGLLRHSGRWNAGWGVPVGQDEMAFTVFSLSLSVARGLGRLGVCLSPAEQEAYYHLWRCAGWVLGVEEARVPAARAQGEASFAELEAREHPAGDDSRRLAADVLDAMGARAPLFLPRAALGEVARRVLGPRDADHLGLPRSVAWRAAATCVFPAVAVVSQLQRLGPVEGFSVDLGWRFARWHLRRGPGVDAPPAAARPMAVAESLAGG